MKFGIFIEEIWAKIVVGTLISIENQFWPLDKKLGAIWLLDCHITIGITSRSSDQHGSDLGRQITLHEGGEISPKNQWFISYISPIYRRYIVDILPLEVIFKKNLRYISPNRYIAHISLIFWRYLRKYLPSDFSSRNIVSTPPEISRHFPPWL